MLTKNIQGKQECPYCERPVEVVFIPDRTTAELEYRECPYEDCRLDILQMDKGSNEAEILKAR